MKVIYLHGQQEDPNVKHITFPTGEKHIRITKLVWGEGVTLVYNDSSGDVIKLALAVDVCRRGGCGDITLVMPFVPYARQDRVADEGDPFSIRVFAGFINSLRFKRVVITDPHSDVTGAVIDNVEIIQQHQLAKLAVIELDEYSECPIAIVAPDLGAAKKIKALQANLLFDTGIEYPIIQCDKTRCVKTGKITGFKILDGNPKNHHCLMVDDICDAGGTFLGLSEIIMKAGATAQSLYVTHGIFSKGVENLLTKFCKIYSSDSFPCPQGVTVIIRGIQGQIT